MSASDVLITWIVASVLYATIPATIAGSKGYGWVAWYVYGVLALPFAFLHALTLQPVESLQHRDKRRCPACAEYVQRDALVCRYCQRALPPRDQLKVNEKAAWAAMVNKLKETTPKPQ